MHEFEFHGQNLMKNFTGTFLFSRALFNVFSGFFTGTVFFFHGEKKTLYIPIYPNGANFHDAILGNVKSRNSCQVFF